MAINYPGPYEVRINYTVTIGGIVAAHQQRLNVVCTSDPVPGTAFADIILLDVTDNNYILQDFLDDWVALIQSVFSSQCSFIDAEFWRYEPGSFDADFISAVSIGVLGTTGATSQPAGQIILTFRTLEGGILKLSFMEGVRALGGPLSYAAIAANEQAIVDFVLGGTNVIMARDTSRPFSFRYLFPGQNEATFKKRYRF